MIFMHPKGIARERIFQRICQEDTSVPSAVAMKRVVFVKEHLLKGSHFWNRVVFSDRKEWNLKGNDAYISI
jgi:hypothetical protein